MSIDELHGRYLTILKKVYLREFDNNDLSKILYNQTYYAIIRKKKYVLATIFACLFFKRGEIKYEHKGKLLLYS